MLSIGDLIDKLVIENDKLFTLRERLHTLDLSDEEYTQIYDKMMILNENRRIICDCLDQKISNVVSGKEPNVLLKNIRTYNGNK
jgi:hypothetical protein